MNRLKCSLCNREATSKGYCQSHYSMVRKRRINDCFKTLLERIDSLKSKEPALSSHLIKLTSGMEEFT